MCVCKNIWFVRKVCCFSRLKARGAGATLSNRGGGREARDQTRTHTPYVLRPSTASPPHPPSNASAPNPPPLPHSIPNRGRAANELFDNAATMQRQLRAPRLPARALATTTNTPRRRNAAPRRRNASKAAGADSGATPRGRNATARHGGATPRRRPAAKARRAKPQKPQTPNARASQARGYPAARAERRSNRSVGGRIAPSAVEPPPRTAALIGHVVVVPCCRARKANRTQIVTRGPGSLRNSLSAGLAGPSCGLGSLVLAVILQNSLRFLGVGVHKSPRGLRVREEDMGV